MFITTEKLELYKINDLITPKQKL